MALEQFKTQVLLLHSEQSTLDSLSSGFNDQYTVHCATSGTEALTTLGETPIHIIVSAQELPGMSGLDALREAKKRSPGTIGILLAGSQSDGLEALVGDHEVFQIVRGGITPEALRGLIDNATRQVRLMALADSANDTTASVDVPAAEHIVMETSENGSTIISDGTGRLPILDPQKVSSATNVGTRAVDVLVLTKDEEFLATIRDSSRGLHNVHYANTVSQADEFVRANKIGVAVIDAAMVGSNVEKLTLHLRTTVPRLVAIVAGRRDDGEMLMDLINRGKVYRFLLKPVSPGRARLAVEASVKHHLEAPDTAFATAGNGASAGSPVKAVSQPAARNKVVPQVQAKAQPKAAQKPVARPLPVIEVSSATDRLSDAFDGDDTSFTETMTGMVKSVGESIAGIRKSKTGEEQDTPKPTESTYSDSSGGSLLVTSKKLGIGAVALIAIAGLAFWLFSGTDESVRNEVLPAETAKISEADSVFDATPPAEVQLASSELLAEARLARGAGQIYNPPGSNAIELYMAASAAAPDDSEIAAEMATVIQQALSNAESALLERRDDDAAAALDRIALAEPENARLPFLNAQLEQMQLRNFLEEARLSIRETRFEDAAIALTGARSLDVAVTTEIETVEVELSDARSAQRADDVLAQAAASLEEGRLTEPSNDNARYYYELVLSNDPGNVAAIQGLSAIASQLVLQARTQIDRGNFNTAETLLADANKLDPSSTAVAESAAALKAAREREARELREEADRQAASERRAAEERAAQQRAAEQQAAEQQAAEQQAAEQQAAEQRATEQRAAEQQAAEQRAAERQAAEQTASSAAAATDNDEQTDDPVVEQSGENAAVVIAGVDSAAIDNGAAASIDETPAEPVNESSTEAVEDQTAEPYVLNDIPINVSQMNRTKYVVPKYPRSAERRRIAGWVDIVFIVTIDGLVRDVTVRDSDPETTFVKAATKAVEDWEFEPVIEDGSAVEKRAAIRLMFAIE